MGQWMTTGIEASGEGPLPSAAWKDETHTEILEPDVSPILNVRAVEFIAKPGVVGELRNCLRGKVLELLRRRTGFAGAILLASHKEPRLVMVLSFWNTEKEATETRWEDSRNIRQTVAPLIDVCSRVHTYEAAIPAAPKAAGARAELLAC
jgi:hypothetical protein